MHGRRPYRSCRVAVVMVEIAPFRLSDIDYWPTRRRRHANVGSDRSAANVVSEADYLRRGTSRRRSSQREKSLLFRWGLPGTDHGDPWMRACLSHAPRHRPFLLASPADSSAAVSCSTVRIASLPGQFRRGTVIGVGRCGCRGVSVASSDPRSETLGERERIDSVGNLLHNFIHRKRYRKNRK